VSDQHEPLQQILLLPGCEVAGTFGCVTHPPHAAEHAPDDTARRMGHTSVQQHWQERPKTCRASLTQAELCSILHKEVADAHEKVGAGVDCHRAQVLQLHAHSTNRCQCIACLLPLPSTYSLTGGCTPAVLEFAAAAHGDTAANSSTAGVHPPTT